MGLTVDLSPIANAHNQNAELPVFNMRSDDSIVANRVLPELAKPGTLQCLSVAAWVLEHSQTFPKECGDPSSTC